MGAVTTSLAEQARSIFTDLGYAVSGNGNELLAERKWRVVHVTLEPPESVPRSGDLRCFVTRLESVPVTCQRVARADPDYEWAVIGVDDDGEYEVFERPLPA